MYLELCTRSTPSIKLTTETSFDILRKHSENHLIKILESEGLFSSQDIANFNNNIANSQEHNIFDYLSDLHKFSTFNILKVLFLLYYDGITIDIEKSRLSKYLLTKTKINQASKVIYKYRNDINLPDFAKDYNFPVECFTFN